MTWRLRQPRRASGSDPPRHQYPPPRLQFPLPCSRTCTEVVGRTDDGRFSRPSAVGGHSRVLALGNPPPDFYEPPSCSRALRHRRFVADPDTSLSPPPLRAACRHPLRLSQV